MQLHSSNEKWWTTSSCDCFSVSLNTKVVPAGEKVLATATVDFTSDPAFKGRLTLSATGKTLSGKVAAFAIHVDVKVG